MPKQTRKRRLEQASKEIEFQIEVPKQKFRPYDELEEEKLGNILFGGKSFLKSLEEAEQEPSCSNADSGVGEEDSSDAEPKERTAAWFDEEDDGIDVGHALEVQGRKLPAGGVNAPTNKYSSLLKHKFQAVVGNPSWASLDKRKDDEILQSCGFIKTASSSLSGGVLEFKKVNDLNCETYGEGPFINSVEFHPKSTVALVGGYNGLANLYAVDGKKNSKLHSVFFKQFPVLCAKFTNDGNEAIIGSRHNYIYSYDLLAANAAKVALPSTMTHMKKFITSPDQKFIAALGKWGQVHLMTASSKEQIASLKLNTEVTALAYSPDGSLLYGHSDSGEVSIWDVRQGKILHKFVDEGCLQGSTLAVSSSNQFLAAGSHQGVVNVYNVEDCLQHSHPKPRKSLMNLTTRISDLKFNATSEMLAFCSVELKNAVRLYHVGSGSVFKNFPPFESKMGQVNVLNFSPNSGYISFGNNKSKAILFTLKHYKSY